MEDLFTTMVIDAYGGSDFGAFDVSGAYLHVRLPIEKHVLLKTIGKFIEIIYNVNL